MNVSSSTAPELPAEGLRLEEGVAETVDPWVLEEDKLAEDEHEATDSFWRERERREEREKVGKRKERVGEEREGWGLGMSTLYKSAAVY